MPDPVEMTPEASERLRGVVGSGSLCAADHVVAPQTEGGDLR